MKPRIHIAYLLLLFNPLVFSVGCGQNDNWTTQVPELKIYSDRYVVVECDCDRQDSILSEWSLEDRVDGISFFQKSSDPNYAAHLLGRMRLSSDTFAILTCECDLLSPETSSLFTLLVTNSQGDSIQQVNLAPFLSTVKNLAAILVKQNEVSTIYQDSESSEVMVYTFLWNQHDRKFFKNENVLSPGLAREKYSLSDTCIVDKIEIPLQKMDTLFYSECDLNVDGISDRLLIVDSHVLNERYETTKFCTLKIDTGTVNLEFNPWILTTTVIPAMSELTDASSGEFDCGKGYFSFSHFDEGGGVLSFKFNYSSSLNQLILESVVFTGRENKVVPCCSHDNPALPDFNYNADGYSK